MEPYAAERGVKLRNAECGTRNAELGDGTDSAGSRFRAPHSAFLDGQAIQQALVNLIDNAIKHSPGGEEVVVALTINHSPSAIHLSVADHGPGIPAAEREKIFERFYRLGSELRRETPGVGIGLSIVKHIVEAHGGRVRVEANWRRSRFTIELPLNGQADTSRERGGGSMKTKRHVLFSLPMNLKVGRAVLSAPRMSQACRLCCGAVRTPRPTAARQFRVQCRNPSAKSLPVEGRGKSESHRRRRDL
jgi:hypothetical protein